MSRSLTKTGMAATMSRQCYGYDFALSLPGVGVGWQHAVLTRAECELEAGKIYAVGSLSRFYTVYENRKLKCDISPHYCFESVARKRACLQTDSDKLNDSLGGVRRAMILPLS